MDYFDLIQKRRSVRDFTSDPVSREDLDEILKAAISAPSAGDLQGYEIYVVKDEKTKNELAEAALGQDPVRSAHVCLVFCASPGRSEQKYGERGRELYSMQDATIATAYSQLAAEALDYGSVWIGAFDEDDVRKVLKIDSSLRPVAILPVGVPKEKPKKTPRRPFDDIVHLI